MHMYKLQAYVGLLMLHVGRPTRHINKYKLLCPRGTQTCALAVVNIKVNGNGKVILDTYPESDQHQN